MFIFYRFRDIAGYLSKVADGVIPVEFYGDLWHQKTKVPGLSCGVVYVILRLAVVAEQRLVTDGRADRRADREDHGPCIASRGKNSLA